MTFAWPRIFERRKKSPPSRAQWDANVAEVVEPQCLREAGALGRLLEQEPHAGLRARRAVLAGEHQLRAAALEAEVLQELHERMLGWPVPLAPVEEQRVLVERLQSALAGVAGLERTVTRALQDAERVERATLARAFRGELVEQDPNDEASSELLARIRAAVADDEASRARQRTPRAELSRAPTTSTSARTQPRLGTREGRTSPARPR